MIHLPPTADLDEVWLAIFSVLGMAIAVLGLRLRWYDTRRANSSRALKVAWGRVVTHLCVMAVHGVFLTQTVRLMQMRPRDVPPLSLLTTQILALGPLFLMFVTITDLVVRWMVETDNDRRRAEGLDIP